MPLGQRGTPDEIAKAAIFLASDDGSFVTGVELFVNGGAAQNRAKLIGSFNQTFCELGMPRLWSRTRKTHPLRSNDYGGLPEKRLAGKVSVVAGSGRGIARIHRHERLAP